MTKNVSTLPVKKAEKESLPGLAQAWAHPFESLHREIDRLFDMFENGRSRRFPLDMEAFRGLDMLPGMAPATDLVETEKEYELTAELPGLDEKDIDISLTNSTLKIRAEKKSEKEEKKKDYYLSERRYGLYERSFQLPDGVDADKISAAFSKGVLTLTLPKTAEARKAERKISVKAS